MPLFPAINTNGLVVIDQRHQARGGRRRGSQREMGAGRMDHHQQIGGFSTSRGMTLIELLVVVSILCSSPLPSSRPLQRRIGAADPAAAAVLSLVAQSQATAAGAGYGCRSVDRAALGCGRH